MGKGSIVAGWIAPHGVVPDMPEDQRARVPATDAAMRTAARRVVAQNPDAVILVTPHGFRSPDINTVSLCRQNAVRLETWYPWATGDLEFESDVDLANLILGSAHEHSVPTAGFIYGATSAGIYPMDWGITGPMRYLLEAGYTGPLVPVTFSALSLNNEWLFGRAIAKAVVSAGKSVAIVASSDLSHVHSEAGPYGYKPIGREFDGKVVQAVRDGDLQSLLSLDVEWVKDAAQDGLRSILTLGGALEDVEGRIEFLAYEVDVYYGMLTALCIPSPAQVEAVLPDSDSTA